MCLGLKYANIENLALHSLLNLTQQSNMKTTIFPTYFQRLADCNQYSVIFLEGLQNNKNESLYLMISRLLQIDHGIFRSLQTNDLTSSVFSLGKCFLVNSDLQGCSSCTLLFEDGLEGLDLHDTKHSAGLVCLCSICYYSEPCVNHIRCYKRLMEQSL